MTHAPMYMEGNEISDVLKRTNWLLCTAFTQTKLNMFHVDEEKTSLPEIEALPGCRTISKPL